MAKRNKKADWRTKIRHREKLHTEKISLPSIAMWSSRIGFLGLLGLFDRIHGYSNPEPCTGDCYAHDPGFIRRSDGVYFRFNTDTYIDIMKSTSSVSGPWEIVGNVLPNGSIVDLAADEGLWVHLLSPWGTPFI